VLVVDVRLDTGPLKAMQDKLEKWSNKAVLANAANEIGLLMVRNIVSRTPVKTGGAKGAVHLKSWDHGGATVVGAISYWPALEEGSRAHVIRPKNAKVLAFKGASGTTVFAKKVMHPGTRGVHAFKYGLGDTAGRVAPIIARHMGMAA
jgi:hypothetical protein